MNTPPATAPIPSGIPFVDGPFDAAAVYCSDGRWAEAADHFLVETLAVRICDRIVVPGGPAVMAEAGDALESLKFLASAHKLDRVVLIQHQGCAFYSVCLETPDDHMIPRQTDDLRRAVGTISAAIPGVRIDAFFAMQTDGAIRFERVEIG